MTKTINELEQEQELLLEAINILDTITEHRKPRHHTPSSHHHHLTILTTTITSTHTTH